MMGSDTLANLAAYVVQIAAVTAVAELLLRVVPVHAAGFRYAYWRLVLLGAIVMPWALRAAPETPVQALAAPAAAALPAAGVLDLALPSTEWAAADAVGPSLLPWLLAFGVVVRLLWVAAGVVRLRVLRRRGTPIADALYEEIQQTLGTRAEVRSVPGLAQPVTFGLRRPVVLLPADLAASRDFRRAVVTHELMHVQRRDWLWVIAEEALRAVLWFHPAIWWLTSRVQLAREEFTDHLTVLATGSRRTYMEALLAFCDADRLAPAPAFARRPHLFHRIVMLSKEVAMSSRRVVVSGAVVAALLVAASWYVSDAFPMVTTPVLRAATVADTQLPATTPPQVNGVTPENPIPRRLFSTPIPFPPELAGSGFVAALEMKVVLNAGGSIASATREGIALSNTGARGRGAAPSDEDGKRAIEVFSEAASRGIRQWQYDPPAQAPLQFYIAVTFRQGQDAAVSQSDTSRTVVAVRGDAFVAAGGRAAGPRVPFPADVLRAGPPAPPPPPLPGQPIRVGGSIRAPMQLRKVNPAYPPIAQSARVQGVVILEVVIDEQGRVADAKILRSIPLLDQAALDAVRQWEYTPTLLNNVPVAVIMTVTVQFTPQQ